jgi:hypothetical protein
MIGPDSTYAEIFLFLCAVGIFGIYLPVIIAPLIARERVCQHTGTPALCRWRTLSIIALAALIVSALWLPCYDLADKVTYSLAGHDASDSTFLALWVVFSDLSALLALTLILRHSGRWRHGPLMTRFLTWARR